MKTVQIVRYDPRWPSLFQTESQFLLHACNNIILSIEHIGSTAIPYLESKPIIDMMGAVAELDACAEVSSLLQGRYAVLHTGMRNRMLFQSTEAANRAITYNLHIVEAHTWETRKERLMRDYLLKHPPWAIEYGKLKSELAERWPDNIEGYTKGKTQFIQKLMDKARAEKGLPSVDVWGGD